MGIEEEEQKRIKMLQEKLEREKAAKDQLESIKGKLKERRRYLYHGGFSQKPIEHYNPVEQGIKQQIEHMQAEANRKALSGLQYEKLKQITDRIDQLDAKIRSDHKAFKKSDY